VVVGAVDNRRQGGHQTPALRELEIADVDSIRQAITWAEDIGFDEIDFVPTIRWSRPAAW